jgi:uncharacterized membrane protein affecting hemolysin expression
MKKTIIITAIIAFTLGILIVIATYFGYVVYKMNAKIDQNTQNIKAIVDFINSNISRQDTSPVTSLPVKTPDTSFATTTEKR